MKLVKKSAHAPKTLSDLVMADPGADWDKFRSNKNRYQKVAAEIRNDQRGICAYCEIDLLRVFPRSQFIVTTHSAQVLTTIEPRCIRKLVAKEGATAVEIPNFSFGAESVQLLEQIQEVETRPVSLEITKKLKKYKHLIEIDEWDSKDAILLRKELDDWAGNKEPELKRLDVDIKMRAFRRGKR